MCKTGIDEPNKASLGKGWKALLKKKTLLKIVIVKNW